MNHVLPLIVLLGCASIANAQKKEKEESASPRNVTIMVDMISVSRKDAFDLVRLDSLTMWAKASEMVKAGTATSEYVAGVTTVTGERTIIECINETRYPTEFEPPLDAAAALAEAQKPTNPPPAELMKMQIVPTAFETRNVGSTMEVLPVIRGEKIWLEMIPSRTVLDRFISYPLGFEKTLLRADQPQFQTFKVQTKVMVSSGKPLFLGAGDLDPSREGKNGDKILLFFVTATLVPVE